MSQHPSDESMLSNQMADCIQDCLNSHAVCLDTAMSLLQKGTNYADPVRILFRTTVCRRKTALGKEGGFGIKFVCLWWSGVSAGGLPAAMDGRRKGHGWGLRGAGPCDLAGAQTGGPERTGESRASGHHSTHPRGF